MQVTTCGILVFIEPGVAQTLYGIVIAVFWLMFFAKLSPFPSLAENLVQTGLNFCVILIMLGALALKLDLTGESNMSHDLVELLLWVATIAPMVTIIGALIVELVWGDVISEERWASLTSLFPLTTAASSTTDADTHDLGDAEAENAQDTLYGPHPSANIRNKIELGICSEA